jgi:hypothetical protein
MSSQVFVKSLLRLATRPEDSVACVDSDWAVYIKNVLTKGWLEVALCLPHIGRNVDGPNKARLSRSVHAKCSTIFFPSSSSCKRLFSSSILVFQ